MESLAIRTAAPSPEEGERRRDVSSWFFSPTYVALASTASLTLRASPRGTQGLFALRPMARKHVACYYPAVVRRAGLGDDTHALTVYTEKRQTPSKAFVCDVPLNADQDLLLPRWRNKPVLGHLACAPEPGQAPNAHVAPLTVSRPQPGDLHYLPIVIDSGVQAGEEILVDFPRPACGEGPAAYALSGPCAVSPGTRPTPESFALARSLLS